MKMIYKHNYKLRLEDLNKTAGAILADFAEQYELHEGCQYRVRTTDGKTFDGFFRRLKISAYRNEIVVWCSFSRSKKDGTPSKVETGAFVLNIEDVTLFPF